MRKKGFTLIELMVVVAVIGILAGMLLPTVHNFVEDTRVNRAAAELNAIKSAMNRYLTDVGSYPPSVQDWRRAWGADVGLVDIRNVHPTHRPLWRGPYLENWPTRTPWGQIGHHSVGAYYVHIPIGWINRDGIRGNDYWIHLNSDHGHNEYPPVVNQRIDERLDDGNPNTGNVRVTGGWRYLYYYVGEGTRSW